MASTELSSAELSEGGSPRGRAVIRPQWSSWRPWTLFNRLLLVLFVGLQFADVVSTNYALAVPGVWEANPMMALSQATLGAAWWLPKLAAIGLVAITAPRSRRRWPMIFIVAISGGAVLLNLAHL
jgi:hypothetical protein